MPNPLDPSSYTTPTPAQSPSPPAGGQDASTILFDSIFPNYERVSQGFAMGADPQPKPAIGDLGATPMGQAGIPWWMTPVLGALGIRGGGRRPSNVVPFPANPATARASQPASQQELTTLRNWARTPPREVQTTQPQPPQRREGNVVPIDRGRGRPDWGSGTAPWEGASPSASPGAGGHVAQLSRLTPAQMEVFHELRRSGKSPAEALATAQSQSE